MCVYDNGCNLAHYCLSREPAFFRNTQQLIDALHYQGHTKCPTSFDITRVNKERRASLKNSQLAEQKNSKVGYIVTQASPSLPCGMVDVDRFAGSAMPERDLLRLVMLCRQRT